MNEKNFDKPVPPAKPKPKFLKKIVHLLGISLFLIAGFFGGLYFFAKKFTDVQDQAFITQKLSETLGFPVQIEKMQIEFRNFSIVVAFKNVVFLNAETALPFATLMEIKLSPTLKTLFLKSSKPEFNKITLNGLKMRLGWNEHNQFTFFGLKGETLPSGTGMGYARLTSNLAILPKIEIENSTLYWQALSTEFSQMITGKIEWIGSADEDWVIVGKQSLQLKEGKKTPATKFRMSFAPRLKAMHLTAGSQNALQCDFSREAELPWQVGCKGEIKNLEIEDLHQYYKPQTTDLLVLQYLHHALEMGDITNTRFKLQEPLDALVWSGEVHYEDVDFQYAPEWPKIEEAAGVVKFDMEKVEVDLRTGKIEQVPIEKASANITPIGKNKNPVVTVKGAVTSTLEKGLKFLQASPLRESIAKDLEPLNPSGPMHLDLHLSVPLAPSEKTAVKGSIAIQNGNFNIQERNMIMTQINGNVEFTEKSVEASEVKAIWLAHPLILSVKTETLNTQKSLLVTGSGSFTSDFLKQQFASPLLDKIKGESHMGITLKLPLVGGAVLPDKSEWIVNSDLRGMSIDLPSFLGKGLNERRSVRLQVGQENAQGERRIALNVKNNLDAKFILMGTVDKLRLKQGHVVFGSGTAEWPTKRALVIGGHLPSFKADDWAVYWEGEGEKDLPPLIINILVGKLEFAGMAFDKTSVNANLSQKPVQWTLNGPTIKGDIRYSMDVPKRLDIKLHYLRIGAGTFGSNTNTTFVNENSKFPIYFYCGNLQYQQSRFGEVSVRLTPQPYGFKINDFIMNTRHSELSGDGEWYLGKGRNSTRLRGKLLSSEVGVTFASWGFRTPIRDSSGTIEYDLTWQKSPFQFSLPLVEGVAQLKFSKGRILGVDPGIGRILGLLSLESIGRRLMLDFSDFKKGFAFDIITGRFTLSKGYGHTDNLKIDGPSAKIELSGRTNLRDKTLNFRMGVTPHTGVGLPLAAALAVGNPAVGAGVWLLDTITGSKFSKITQHFYQVSGTWDQPRIHKVGEKNQGSDRPSSSRRRR